MRKAVSLFTVASMYMCVGTFTGAWVHSQSFRGHSLEEDWLSFSQQRPTVSSSSARSGTLWSSPCSIPGFCLAWSFMGLMQCQQPWVLCATSYCVLKNTVSLWSPSASDSYSTSTLSSVRSLGLLRRRSDVDVLFRLSFLYSLLFSAHWPVTVPCVNFHLPLKEASLGLRDAWVSGCNDNITGSQFHTMPT